MKTSENQNTRTPNQETGNQTNNQNPQVRTNQNQQPTATNQPTTTNQPTATNQPTNTNQPTTTNQNTQIPNPGKQPSPGQDPIRKQPHVDPDPTAPSPDEKRTDPYATKNPSERTNSNDLKEQQDKDAYPTGKSKDTSVNETSHKPTNVNPATERNSDRNNIDRETTK